MRQRTRHALATLVVAAGLVSTPTTAQQPDPATAASERSESKAVALQPLLDRAADYLDQFSSDFRNVVAEERYVQQVAGRPTMLGLRGSTTASPTASSAQRRELVSDFLLVKLANSDMWVPFR